MPRVYIHEFIDIIGNQRAKYLHHMTANWGPIGRAERNQLCFGVWGVVGSTGAWPQVVNLWEYQSWESLAQNFEFELSSTSMQDPSLAQWWNVAASLRRGGVDRILVAPDWSPSIEELCADRSRMAPAGYCHELVGCRPGTASELLESVRSDALPAYAESGLSLVGAFGRAMVADDQILLIWSFDAWTTWASFEGPAPAVSAWRDDAADLVTTWERIVMTDAEFAPLRTGRQPQETDRRDLDQF